MQTAAQGDAVPADSTLILVWDRSKIESAVRALGLVQRLSSTRKGGR